MADDLGSPFPLEFIIGETPVSSQAKNAKRRQAWQARVGEAARAALNKACELYFLDGRPLMVTILYFPEVAMVGDIDNIVKPVVDGMVTVAYPDDRVVERLVVQKFEPDVEWRFASPSALLVTAVDMAKPSLYVRVEDDLAWRQVS